MEYNNNNYYNAQAMGTPYAGQPYVQNYVPVPNNVSSLNEDEIKTIQNNPPKKFDITISQQDNLISICNHKHNGQDMVRQVNDGSDDVFCPICNQRWSPHKVDREELEICLQRFTDAMQNCKWVGDLNIQLIRDYFPILPLLQKFPDLYEQSMNQFSRYINQNPFQDANDANVYSQYNALMGRTPMMNQPYGMGYNVQQVMPGQVPVQQYPYGQPQQPNYQQPAYNPAMNQPQNPMYNPMQVQQPPMNTQFTDQNQMMMQGQYYAPQPNYQQPAYNPAMGQPQQPINMNTAQVQPQNNYMPNYAPVGQQPAQQGEAPVDANGTVNKDTTVKID